MSTDTGREELAAELLHHFSDGTREWSELDEDERDYFLEAADRATAVVVRALAGEEAAPREAPEEVRSCLRCGELSSGEIWCPVCDEEIESGWCGPLDSAPPVPEQGEDR